MQFLNRQELTELTHKIRPSAQARALGEMGIEYRVRPDGSVAVLKSVVEKALGGVDRATHPKEFSVNLEGVH